MSAARDKMLRLRKEVDAMKKELARKQKQLDRMIALRVEEMRNEGISSEKLITGETLVLSSTLRVSKRGDATTEQVVEALKASGYGSLCGENYASSSLAALVRELRKNKEQIPPALAPLINEYDDVTIQVRKR